MDIEEYWEKALRETGIIRARIATLSTFQSTHVPYLLLSASSLNVGDTVVRKGEIVVEKPTLILPPNIPQFNGFRFEEDGFGNPDSLINYLLVRGIHLPSLKYQNKTYALDIFEGRLSEAIEHFKNQLQYAENVHTGLITGPEDCWRFSLIIFICSQIVRNAERDIQKLLEEYKKKPPHQSY